jgi:hypothetical protein
MRHLVTPSLLNSWKYVYESRRILAASRGDWDEETMDAAEERAMADFRKALSREREAPSPAMLRGMEYEDATYRGETDCSPIVEGGAFQIVGTKKATVMGEDYLLYGRLDCLKCGMVYDIKRVSHYEAGKYKWSAQHGFYLTLFPEAWGFEYLAFDGKRLHRERYWRDECRPTEAEIAEFAAWLKLNGLWAEYEDKWKSRED